MPTWGSNESEQPALNHPSAAGDGGPSRVDHAAGGAGSRYSRRSLLRGGAFGGVAALIAAGGAGPPGPAAPAAGASPAAQHQLQNLFALTDLDFETLIAFGAVGYGCAEFGELVTAANQVNTMGASYQTYYDVFLALAQGIGSLADHELAAGHTASARSAYLRASTYYYLCLYFVLGTRARAREAGAYAAMQRCWQQASQLFDPPFEAVRIPYGSSWLPGYLLRPDDRSFRRPTVILNNGADAQDITLYSYGGADAVQRGYNALIFEGPGQGSMLFERQVRFRPDWENVITPVVDYLRSRPEVDPERIALIGLSLGGELVMRAAAGEHRLAAVVADPGVLSTWFIFETGYPVLASLFANGASKDQVNAAWQTGVVPKLSVVDRYTLAKRSEPFGRQFLLAARADVFSDLYDLGTSGMQFSCAEVLDQVTAPTFVTAYQYDQYVLPASQAKMVYDGLSGPKQFHYFTAAEGAQYHCAPMAPQTRNQVVYDWLDHTL
jgi:Alpha/beta hydrolase family